MTEVAAPLASIVTLNVAPVPEVEVDGTLKYSSSVRDGSATLIVSTVAIPKVPTVNVALLLLPRSTVTVSPSASSPSAKSLPTTLVVTLSIVY